MAEDEIVLSPSFAVAEEQHTFPAPSSSETPIKCIHSPQDLAFFKSSASYRTIIKFLDSFAASVARSTRSECDPLEEAPFFIQSLCDIFSELRVVVGSIALHDMKSQRYGNKAFREFHTALSQKAAALLTPVVNAVDPSGSEISKQKLVAELQAYLLDSFGNPQRIDYGTGHELHFIVAMYILCKTFNRGKSLDDPRLLRCVAYHVFWRYLDFMRFLQQHYSLEPAGSHGVWGLDDYHHIPFILGASQLRGNTAFRPKDIVDERKVKELRGENFYAEMILWINENKRGPFHEHSSILFNVSGLETWDRIAIGMLKMYEGEVLSKIVIVQHLLFGEHFPFA